MGFRYGPRMIPRSGRRAVECTVLIFNHRRLLLIFLFLFSRSEIGLKADPVLVIETEKECLLIRSTWMVYIDGTPAVHD